MTCSASRQNDGAKGTQFQDVTTDATTTQKPCSCTMISQYHFLAAIRNGF